ncbi:acyltransferase family protein [Alistipes onderdonkii]|uniref:acyltransferase family protein n=1 Tax=Alistipes onderdonkii TaxID=328813 RepID=UPI0032EF3161
MPGNFGRPWKRIIFFVSGYLLIDSIRKSANGWNWYKHKIRRILPAVFIWCICASIFFGKPITWKALVFADNYWFIQCILIYYAILYPAIKRNIGLNQLFAFSLIISVIYFFVQVPGGGGVSSTLIFIMYITLPSLFSAQS